MAGFPLTGVDPNDPIPGTLLEIRFAQGQGTGGGTSRDVLLFGNKLAAGSEATNTLGDAIADAADCIARFAQKSEIYQMYRKYVEIDKQATIYAIAIPEAGGATAASKTFTFANTATDTTTLVIECVGEQIEVTIANGDLIGTIATNVSNAINDQNDWPVSAAPVLGVVTVTSSNLGPRNDYIVDRIRMFFRKDVTTTVTLGALTSGTGEDDLTTALTLLSNKSFYYQVNPKHPTAGTTATDNGIGEHAAFITAQALPDTGIRNQMIFAQVSTIGTTTTVVTSVNNARAFCIWSENCKLPPCMMAAMFAAVKRKNEISHPAANLTNYGTGITDIFNVPAPASGGDQPTRTELRSALNNGITPIAFTPTGQSYLVRHITTRSLLGSANDYRVRSGHIPSALDYSGNDIQTNVDSVAQDWVADDPPEGAVPLQGVTTPGSVASMIKSRIDALVAFTGGPVLDPSFQQVMKDSVQTVRLTNGTSSRVELQAVKPNDKTHLLLLETSTGY